MKQRISKALSIIIACCVAVAFVVIPTTNSVYANDWGAVKYAKKITVIYTGGEDDTDLIINMGAKAKNAKKITVTSSNKKIAIPWKSSWTKLPKKYAGAVIKKPGKVTLTIKVTNKNNKSKKYKCKVTALAYENPFQTFAVGTMDLLPLFDSPSAHIYQTEQAVTGQLSIAPKAGWVIDQIEYSKNYGGNGDEEPVRKEVKDGDIITLTPTVKNAEWCTYLDISMHNPTLGIKLDLELSPYEDYGWEDEFENPLVTLKVGDLDLTSAFDQGERGEYTLDRISGGLISVTPKTGWEIDEITCSQIYYTDDTQKTLDRIDEQVVKSDWDVVTLAPTAKRSKWETNLRISMHNDNQGLEYELLMVPHIAD